MTNEKMINILCNLKNNNILTNEEKQAIEIIVFKYKLYKEFYENINDI